MNLRALSFAFLIWAPLIVQAQPATVSISGAVNAPGNYQWQAGTRLLDLTVAGQVNAQAWPLGAALLRQSAIEPQQRLKAGVLFDLRANLVHAQSRGDASLHSLLADLIDQLNAMPTTGRVVAQLDPLQQLLLANNPLLEPGDGLVYPRRPDYVRVLGAVDVECALDFVAEWQARDYLRACELHRRSDPSYVYILQPDGLIQKAGVGYWNAEALPIAVGAVLFVPINPRYLSEDAADLNEELAAMLATQYRLGGRFDD